MCSISRLSVVVWFLLPLCSAAQESDYCRIYDAECRQTLVFWQTHEAEFEAAAERAGVPAEFMFAIVAPEISQYGRLADKAQTYALKTLYVQRGRESADFSIGLFQMKPSFVEELERYVLDTPALLAAFAEVPISGDTERKIRVLRIERLERQDWQMTYLALFCRVVRHRFGDEGFGSEQERLRFYANAYNAGFMLDGERLRQSSGAYFPHLARRKFRYADVSLWFFRKIGQLPDIEK